jgi:pimeloyl-ACP methyl ester carboxylesterase
VPLLAPHFTCVVVDQAGAGATRTTPSTDYNFRRQARRLNAFIASVAVEHGARRDAPALAPA